MLLKSLILDNFRNYTSSSFSFSDSATLIVGPNAAGKTAIIEAINALATGNSFRADRTEEMIRFDQELARVKGIIETDAEKIDLELLLTRGLVQGKKTQKRLYSINSTRRTKRKFVGNLLTVVFRPEDMRLIEGSPSRRRDFLDGPLQLLFPEYVTALSTYTQALIRRNRLLTQVREGEMSQSTLTFWTMTILKHGEALQQFRQQFMEFCETVSFSLDFTIEYQQSVISQERLDTYVDREIAAGHTLVGPHKDDFIVKLNDRDVAAYGSRGQQRMAVLWLKTCEQAFIREQTGNQPLLLLDDILSELDEKHRELVLHQLTNGQTIITSADQHTAELLYSFVATLTTIELSKNDFK